MYCFLDLKINRIIRNQYKQLKWWWWLLYVCIHTRTPTHKHVYHQCTSNVSNTTATFTNIATNFFTAITASSALCPWPCILLCATHLELLHRNDLHEHAQNSTCSKQNYSFSSKACIQWSSWYCAQHINAAGTRFKVHWLINVSGFFRYPSLA